MDSFNESNALRSNLFPSLYEYPEDAEESGQENNADSMTVPEKPKIIIMGGRRSGKSSIQKVVFDKMSPNETLFLDTNSKVHKEDISDNSIVSFSVRDFPSHIEMFEQGNENTFKNCGALIFVIDSQDEHTEALMNLNSIVRQAHSINPNINFEVFIHKVDGLSDDHKIETRQSIHQRANEELFDLNEENDGVLLSFYLTSIYDHSIFEAFSKVVQKLIPQLPILENILNYFNSVSLIEKSFLFDVASKIFIATDSSPVDMQSYELCCDMIDVVMDISCIYGTNDKTTTKESYSEKNTAATIRINSNAILYLRQVNKFLALVCMIREENFTMEGLVDYNFQCVREAIQTVFSNGKDYNRAMSSTNNILQRMQTYPNEEIVNGADTESLREYSSSKPQEIVESSPTTTVRPARKTNIHDSTRNNFATQRKIAIMPTNSTVSSLPNNQNFNHPSNFQSSVDEGLTFNAPIKSKRDSH